MNSRPVILLTCSLFCFSLLVHGQENKISRLLPHHGKIQFAGGIGFMSAGFGYATNNKKFNIDAYYGYVPENLGGIEIHSVTSKVTWIPISRNLCQDIHWQVLTTGVLVNYAFGEQYFFLSPTNYPLKYYGLPTAAHIGFFVGGGLQYRKVGCYFELGSTDKSLGSYVRNVRSLKLTSILNIAFGLKVSFRDKFPGKKLKEE
jgi:hypothetical protein